MIETRDEKQLDTCFTHELDFLIECAYEARCAIGNEEVGRMGPEGHRGCMYAERPRARDDRLQNFPVPEVQAIEVADAHYGRMRNVCIGQ